jgi:hypothetical protein
VPVMSACTRGCALRRGQVDAQPSTCRGDPIPRRRQSPTRSSAARHKRDDLRQLRGGIGIHPLQAHSRSCLPRHRPGATMPTVVAHMIYPVGGASRVGKSSPGRGSYKLKTCLQVVRICTPMSPSPTRCRLLTGDGYPSMGGSCSKPPWLPRRPPAQPVLPETRPAATARIMQHPSESHPARNFVPASTRQLMQLTPSCIVSQPMRLRYGGLPRQHVRRTRMS